MFYRELYHTEVEAENLKKHFAALYKKQKTLDPLLKECHERYLSPIRDAVEQIGTSNPLKFEHEFLRLKQQLLEIKVWLKLLYETASEVIPSFSHISPWEISRQQAVAQAGQLLEKLSLFDSEIQEMRKRRLTEHLHTHIPQALKNIEKPLSKTLSNSSPEKEEIVADFVSKQKIYFEQLALFFQAHSENWEKMVLEEMKGLLFLEPKHLPFAGVYTVRGTLYIILEVKGHFLGLGSKKVICRCVNLQTGEILAAVKVRAEFPDAADHKEEEKLKRELFAEVWQESEILIKLAGKAGILRVRDRLCFEKERAKELYLFEDYFEDGSLQDYFDGKSAPLTLPQKQQIAFQILTGLQHIHELGYIHADIKADNILLNLQGRIPLAVITDLSSTYHEEDPYTPLKLEHTVLWCAPEVAKIMSQLSSPKDRVRTPKLLFKTDIWSMGCVLYMLFFDAPLPWAKEGREKIYDTLAHLKPGWIPSLYQHDPLFPLITRMLEIDPVNRPTAQETLSQFVASR